MELMRGKDHRGPEYLSYLQMLSHMILESVFCQRCRRLHIFVQSGGWSVRLTDAERFTSINALACPTNWMSENGHFPYTGKVWGWRYWNKHFPYLHANIALKLRQSTSTALTNFLPNICFAQTLASANVLSPNV